MRKVLGFFALVGLISVPPIAGETVSITLRLTGHKSIVRQDGHRLSAATPRPVAMQGG